MLDSLSIRTKLLMVLLCAAVGTVILSVVLLINERTTLYAAKRTELQRVVETAHGILDSYAEQARSGALSEPQARQAAFAVLRHLRYGNDDYFFVTDFDSNMLAHGAKPALEGKNQIGLKDVNGIAIVGDLVAVAKRQGHGFLEYMWPKSSEQAPVPKLSYAKAFGPWQVVVVSGIYIDDIQAQFWAQTRRIGLLVLVLAIVVGGIQAYVMLHVGQQINRARLGMTRIQERGDFAAQLAVTGRNEVGDMIGVFNALMRQIGGMLDKLRSNAADVQASASRLTAASADANRAVGTETRAVADGAAAVEELNAALHSTSTSARELDQGAAAAVSETEGLSGRIDTMVGALTSVGGSIEEISTSVEKFVEASASIHDLTGQVKEIAAQTNLLALNAAIEAARAGDVGRGFAVVADEVRKLAEKAAHAATEIDAVTQRLEGHSDTVTTSVNAGKSNVMASIDTLEGVAFGIDALRQAVEETKGHAAAIAASIQGQTDASNAIAANMAEIAAMAEQSSGATDRVAAEARALESVAGRLGAAATAA